MEKDIKQIGKNVKIDKVRAIDTLELFSRELVTHNKKNRFIDNIILFIMEGNGMGLAIKTLFIIMAIGVLVVAGNALGVYNPTNEQLAQVTPPPTQSPVPTVSVITSSTDVDAVLQEVDSMIVEIDSLQDEISSLDNSFETAEIEVLGTELDNIN
ncbi:hypothetical protein IT418_00095 [bacterium]|nr:hypothetical protein [bacterium]